MDRPVTLSTTEYIYDKNGNRTSVIVTPYILGVAQSPDPTGYVSGAYNQTESNDDHIFEYDDEGNRTAQNDNPANGTYEYDWDHRNRLVEVRIKDSNGDVQKSVKFTYDPLNRRISKTVDSDGDGPLDGESIYYISDGDRASRDGAGDQVVLVLDDAGNITNRYLYGAAVDQILADEPDTGDVLWPLADNLGSIRDLAVYDSATDTTSTPNHIVYDAYGNIVSETNDTIDHLFGYTGREFDAEIGLQYNRARYYDAAIGKWISTDPIGFSAGDANLYRYVGNHGTYTSDPSGLDYRENFLAELKKRRPKSVQAYLDLEQTLELGSGNTKSWEVHHWYSQNPVMSPWLERMSPKGFLTNGVNTVEQLVAVPKPAHNQITREQKEFWDRVGEELGVDRGNKNYRSYEDVMGALEKSDEVTQKKHFTQYTKLVKTQKKNWGSFTIGVDATVGDINKAHKAVMTGRPQHLSSKHLEAFEKSRSRYLKRASGYVEKARQDLLHGMPSKIDPEKWDRWLSKLGLVVLFADFYSTSTAIAAPSAEQKRALLDVMKNYQNGLMELQGNGKAIKGETVRDITDSVTRWMDVSGLPDSAKNSVQIGGYLEAAKR